MGAWCEETLAVHRSGEPVATKLHRIAEKARKEPGFRFTSLYHLMNKELLRGCFQGLRKDAAAGIDGMTKEMYAVKLRGHYNYYGVTDNYRGLMRFEQAVKRLLFKWLNRRGKRKCLNWEEFNEMLQRFPLPKPRIMVSMFGLAVNTM